MATSTLLPEPPLFVPANCGYDVWNTLLDNKDNEAAMNDLQAPAWVRESEFRGSYSILQSCILTLFACIYSALHLNVPMKTNWWYIMLNKILWSLIALFAPEYVLGIALLQFVEAWELRMELRSIVSKKITLTYAFFIVMGGLQVRVNAFGDLNSYEMDEAWRDYLVFVRGVYFSPDIPYTDDKTLRLTPYGVRQLAYNHMDDVLVPESMIVDKSKVNVFQKTLVLIQISWMAAVCVVRKVNGLPLTLLEIHTMIHAVCALFIFSLWFYKPLDIQDPEVRTGEHVRKWGWTFQNMARDTFRTDSQHKHSFSLRSENSGTVHGWQLRDLAMNDIKIGLLSGMSKINPSTNRRGLRPFVVFLPPILSLLYGSIHLAAWNSHFPTKYEGIAWKVACIILMAAVPYGVLAMLAGHVFRKDDQHDNPYWPVTTLGGFFYKYRWTLPLIPLALARIYIIAESFAGMRQNPIGVFWVPSWLQTMPHV